MKQDTSPSCFVVLSAFDFQENYPLPENVAGSAGTETNVPFKILYRKQSRTTNTTAVTRRLCNGQQSMRGKG
jgi:hypothetical protein